MKLNTYLINVSKKKFYIVTITLGIFLSFILNFVFVYFFNETFVDKNSTSYTIQKISFLSLFTGILLNPFLETWFFQYFIIVILGKKQPINTVLYLLFLSSFIFAGLHAVMSLAYGIAAFFMGLYFGYIAILSSFLRPQKIPTLISVFAVHATINASVLIPRYLISLT